MISPDNQKKSLLRHCFFLSFLALKIRAPAGGVPAFRGPNQGMKSRRKGMLTIFKIIIHRGTPTTVPTWWSARSMSCSQGLLLASGPPFLGFPQKTHGSWWRLLHQERSLAPLEPGSLLQVKQTQGSHDQFWKSNPLSCPSCFWNKTSEK